MGLPIFITPVEPEVASQATEKLAAEPRSSIRRQRTIRGGSQGRSPDNRRDRRRRIQELLDSATQRNAADTSSIASLQARANRFFENERALNERTARSDPLSWERRRPEEYSPDPSFLPPAPDPELEAHNRHLREEALDERAHMRQVRRDLERTGRVRPLPPTPPDDETETAFTGRGERGSSRPSPPEGDREISAVPPWVTVGTAPADIAPRRYREFQEEYIHSSLPDQAARADRIRSLNRASMIRDMRRTRASFRDFLRQTRMDGLGDRDRSLSPEGGAAWDTLLTSITPDPQPPSAGSSFASSSAAAAAASSSSNSAPAWGGAAGTTMTSPERSGESAALRDCDESSLSDSNLEDEDEVLHGLNRMESTRRGDRYGHWRSSYADVARDSGDAQSPDMELRGMQRVISHLAERDDIPNSWWATVGLRREPPA